MNKRDDLSVRHVIFMSLTQMVMFVIGYVIGFIIRDLIVGVKTALKDMDEAFPYGKALLQIFINAFLLIYASKVLKLETLMFSIGLFSAQSKLLGTAIFERVDKQMSQKME